MPSYNPPLRDMQFLMHEPSSWKTSTRPYPSTSEVDADTINAVLEEAGKFVRPMFTFPAEHQR